MVRKLSLCGVLQMFQTVIDEYEVFGGAMPYDNNAYYAIDGCVFSYSINADANHTELSTEPGSYLRFTEISI